MAPIARRGLGVVVLCRCDSDSVVGAGKADTQSSLLELEVEGGALPRPPEELSCDAARLLEELCRVRATSI